jgi:hypothetical protein
MILGLPATRVLASIVYQAMPRDPMVLAGVILAMMGVGLIAAWTPARQALAVTRSSCCEKNNYSGKTERARVKSEAAGVFFGNVSKRHEGHGSFGFAKIPLRPCSSDRGICGTGDRSRQAIGIPHPASSPQNPGVGFRT